VYIVKKVQFIKPDTNQVSPWKRDLLWKQILTQPLRIFLIFYATRNFITVFTKAKLHNEELHNLYCSQSIIIIIKSTRIRKAGHVARMGERRNAYRILVGNPEGKRPLGRPRRRWVNNIKMDLRQIGFDGMDWINVAQDRDQWRALVNTVMNFPVRQNAGKFSTSRATGGSSRRAQLHD
jgi:hypothetical protein